MPTQGTARALQPDLTGRLAKFFPDATPVRIPIKLSRAELHAELQGEAQAEAQGEAQGKVQGKVQAELQGKPSTPSSFLQSTIIEFGTPREILFVVDCPLEFADRVLVESNDGALCAEACVVAVQYHPHRTVVAARFLKAVPNWIIKS